MNKKKKNTRNGKKSRKEQNMRENTYIEGTATGKRRRRLREEERKLLFCCLIKFLGFPNPIQNSFRISLDSYVIKIKNTSLKNKKKKKKKRKKTQRYE